MIIPGFFFFSIKRYIVGAFLFFHRKMYILGIVGSAQNIHVYGEKEKYSTQKENLSTLGGGSNKYL